MFRVQSSELKVQSSTLRLPVLNNTAEALFLNVRIDVTGFRTSGGIDASQFFAFFAVLCAFALSIAAGGKPCLLTSYHSAGLR
jgi:hypothetical protein